MDWITLLRSLQSDFINRLTTGCLLHCETEGQHSELTIISGERLKALREFCWLMAEKYKRLSPVRDVFINNLKGKLGEEVVKERLANFITEVDYEKRFGGDGKSDFTLTAEPSIGVEVKSRHGRIDRVRWSISSEEVEKNAVVVCILIQEEVNEAQPEYHLFLAGFLPTKMIKLKTGRISFGIEQLLYGGGLRCYLEQLQSAKNGDSYHKQSIQPLSVIENGNNLLDEKLGDECFARGDFDAALTNYNKALKLHPDDADIYYKRGLARHEISDYAGAIADYNQAIKINPNNAKAYNKRGLSHYQLGDYEAAIDDYNQAIRINPHVAVNFKNRADARSQLGDNQGAIEDYTQAIKINPNYAIVDTNGSISRYLLTNQQKFTKAIKLNPHDAVAYKNRADARYDLGDYEGAIADYIQVIKINPNYIDAYYNCGNARYDLGDYEGAIASYTQVIKINANYIDAYYNRGNARFAMGNKQGSLEDFQKAADMYWKEGKLAEHKDVRQKILDLEIEASLDILNF
ncbi:tetratricopeptide repeat protein [Calothrix sp. PCC 7507]|uniref:tetratricopeptide repeat protein n=1 Tax=Calothrix sp. PCC 7507 TaxID=99598 RepID=UPI00029ED3E4|nr:tetratricopeptide repeat protein [Calothrix sp. PCC 7507]AFY31530.1 Tetratricopeptide TPR_1 repeat-containing protein [Calothrix sp. PCC 7507]